MLAICFGFVSFVLYGCLKFGASQILMSFFTLLGDVPEVKEDLNENTYTNEAYKMYLNDKTKEYTHQNTKVSLRMIKTRVF